jgi:hypothetical protein
VSEDDLRVIAEHGYEGAASTDQDERAQAVSLFITDVLASIGRGNGVTTVATPFPSQSSPIPVRSTVAALPVNDDVGRSGIWSPATFSIMGSTLATSRERMAATRER